MFGWERVRLYESTTPRNGHFMKVPYQLPIEYLLFEFNRFGWGFIKSLIIRQKCRMRIPLFTRAYLLFISLTGSPPEKKPEKPEEIPKLWKVFIIVPRYVWITDLSLQELPTVVVSADASASQFTLPPLDKCLVGCISSMAVFRGKACIILIHLHFVNQSDILSLERFIKLIEWVSGL